MAEFEVDAIVVGSGFGGSVSACRLAEAGRRVVVFERGKTYPPGSFPRSPSDMARNFWDPSQGLHGMFDLWSFRGLEAVVGAGLGGGSLIYANVLLRKDPKWFVREDAHRPGYEYWPVTYDDLEPHYERAEQVLGATPYPFDHAPYDATPKTAAFRDAARALDLDWRLPPLAVTFGADGDDPAPGVPFGSPGDNLHGRQRLTCRLCGECDVGCNEGSKNTTDYTYLSMAARAGADIRDRCEVRRIETLDDGYRVTWVHHDPADEGVPTATRTLPEHSLTTRVLVLSAGTLGSTYLLLRNRSALPHLSRRLGSRFSGNGDLLGFVSSTRRLDPATGPVITSTIRVDDEADGGEGRGFYLQEGGYPGFADWLVETASLGPMLRGLRFAFGEARRRLADDPVSRIGTQIGAMLGEGGRSAGKMVMLGMGRDIPDGTMRLDDGWLDIDWTTATSRAFFERIEETMADVAASIGGDLVRSPLSWLGRVVTVHPLGGCPMGRDSREGVVDDHGEVYDYPGLFVADGAVMPGPVGPNPSLTIAALAERFSARMIDRSAPRG